MVIADYLYASENAMSVFLRGYDKWLAAVEDPDAEAIFGALEEDTARSAVVKSSSQDLLSAYHSLGITCPFLDKTRCAIYPVRPVCCAAYFSVSSPELCRADSATPAAIIQVKPSEKNLRHFTELADIRLSAHQENLPKLVYKLLTMGFSEVYLEVEKLFKTQGRTPPAGEQPSPGIPKTT
jgi:Fe-S-cluster containining protein